MTSSVALKGLMAVSGLFLCVFLVVHVLGNIPLLLPVEDARQLFNRYAALLSGLAVIQFASLVTLVAILLHAVLGVLLTRRSRAVKAGRYAVQPTPPTSPWYTRAMGITGALVFVFLVVHLRDFWYPYMFGGDAIGNDAAGRRDLYGIVAASSRRWWHVSFYVISMAALGFHLYHGVYSGFRSLGVHSGPLSHWIKVAALVFAALVCGLFAAMPVYLFFIQH